MKPIRGIFLRKARSSYEIMDKRKEIKEIQKIENKTDNLQNIQDFYTSFIKDSQAVYLEHKKKILFEKIQQLFKKFNQKVHTESFIKFRDKLIFELNLMNIFLGIFILGKFPCYFHMYYILNIAVLMSARLIINYVHKYQFFLIDFCYYSNTLTIIYLVLHPNNQLLYNIVFAFDSGPLLMAVIYLRNSFVPHSIEQMTNLLLHTLPSLSLWSLKAFECSKCMSSMVPLSLWEYVKNSALVYLVWNLMYSFIVFYLASELIEKNGYMTFYKLVMGTDIRIRKFSGVLGERFEPMIFMFQHAANCIFLMIFTYLLLCYNWIFTIWLFFVCCYGIWNGSCYYIEFFSARYLKDIKSIEQNYLNLA